MAANKLILEFVDASKPGGAPSPPPGGGPTPTSPTPSVPTPVSGQTTNVGKMLAEQKSQFGNLIQAFMQAQGGNVAGAINTIGGPGTAKAAGVAGAVAMVVSKVKEETKQLLDQVRGDVQAAGRASRQIVDNDIVGAMETHVDRFGESLDRVSPMLGTAFRTTTEPLKQFTGLIESLVQRGKTQIAELDARTAQASAIAELREMKSLLKEANELGGEYAELIERTSRWQEAIESDILIPLKRDFLALANVTTEFFEKILTAVFGLKVGDEQADEFDRFLQDWMNGKINQLGRQEANGFINATLEEKKEAREALRGMITNGFMKIF